MLMIKIKVIIQTANSVEMFVSVVKSLTPRIGQSLASLSVK